MRKKRRSRGYRSTQKKNGKPNFVPVVVILCLSIGCGYATAKYVVDPVVNYIPQLTAGDFRQTEQKESEASKETDESRVLEDDVNVEETGETVGYAVQFGCYSEKESAEKAMAALDMTGLQIMEQNDMYKIVGEVFETKEKAKEALDSVPDSVKAFVTTLYKQ